MTVAITLPSCGCPGWATEVSVADPGTPDEFVSYSADLFSGLILPHYERVGATVDLHLIAWQHNTDDVFPANQAYLEVAAFCDGYNRTLLLLTAVETRTLADALINAAATIDASNARVRS